METVLNDIRYAARSLRRRPGFTLVAVITLALGMGANTAIFSLVYGVLLRPLPFPHSDRLVMLWQDWSERGGPEREWWSYPNFWDTRATNTSLEDMAVFSGWGPGLETGDGVELLRGAFVSHSYHQLLGVQPQLGSLFVPEDDVPGAGRRVLIGYGLWQRRFGGDGDVLGRVMDLDGESYTVAGILPEGFRAPFLGDVEIWTTMQRDPAVGRGSVTMRAVGRVADGVSMEQAAADLDRVAARLEEAWPEENTDIGIALYPLRAEMVSGASTPLWVLFGVVGLVLLIACANVASLMLTRATDRSGETAVRIALGADRGRLVRQLLTESTLIALMGGAAGLLLALWGIDGLIRAIPDAVAIPRLEEVGVNAGVLLFTFGAIVLTTLLFGLVPSIRGARVGASEVLRTGTGRGTASRTTSRLRGLFVVLETAFALIALTGAGLLLRSLQELRQVDTGFDATGVLTATTFMPPRLYESAEAQRVYLENAVERLRALPGVEQAASVSTVPLSGNATDASFRIVGEPEPEPGREPVAWYRQVMPGYLDLMRIPLRAGRYLGEEDGNGAAPVVVVNETFVRRYFQDGEAIGRQLAFGGDLRVTVVGVVSNIRHFGLTGDPPPAMYLSALQFPPRRAGFVVRTSGDPSALAGAVRAALTELDPRLPVFGLGALASLVRDAVAPERFTGILVLLFALIALLLAAVGLYGVISFSISLRTREIGVRMAMGAATGRVIALVVRQGLLLTGLGVLFGIAGGYAFAAVMRGFLFGVEPTDLRTYVAVAVVMLASALTATWIPARRASRIDPVVALRQE